MYFKHVHFSALANPAAIFMILIGTVGAVMNAFPMRDLTKIGSLFRIIFLGPKIKINNKATLETMMNYAQLIRKESPLAIEKEMDKMADPFMKRGFDLFLLAQPHEKIEEILFEDIEAMEARHQANAQIFTQAGTYAPTLGVLGAVVGLIAALSNMGDQKALGDAISAAFIATIYGIFTGYVLWHPFANKLKRASKMEAINKSMIATGIVEISQGSTLDVIKEKMYSYMESGKRNVDISRG